MDEPEVLVANGKPGARHPNEIRFRIGLAELALNILSGNPGASEAFDHYNQQRKELVRELEEVTGEPQPVKVFLKTAHVGVKKE